MTINVSIINGVLQQKLNKASTEIPANLRPRSFNSISAKSKFIE